MFQISVSLCQRRSWWTIALIQRNGIHILMHFALLTSIRWLAEKYDGVRALWHPLNQILYLNENFEA